MIVSEVFYSIEGEGIGIGKPEVFVRLANCNLRCTWCDTKHSWKGGREMTVLDVVTEISKYPCKNVSITGGEPLLQKKELLELIRRLKKDDYWIQINTNGTLIDENIFDMVDLISMDCKCPSSGTNSDLEVIAMTKELFGLKSQFKFVISNEGDYQYAKNIVSSSFRDTPNIVFQPQWAVKNFSIELAELIMRDRLNVRLILQQHKVIWGNKRGI